MWLTVFTLRPKNLNPIKKVDSSKKPKAVDFNGDQFSNSIFHAFFFFLGLYKIFKYLNNNIDKLYCCIDQIMYLWLVFDRVYDYTIVRVVKSNINGL